MSQCVTRSWDVQPTGPTYVIGRPTNPVLAIIALDWTLADEERPAGRLPKYNPDRRKTFAMLCSWYAVRPATSSFRTRRCFGTSSSAGAKRLDANPRAGCALFQLIGDIRLIVGVAVFLTVSPNRLEDRLRRSR